MMSPNVLRTVSGTRTTSTVKPNPPTPTPPKGGQCGKDEWSFSGGNKKCCLPHTPPSNPPSPPSGHQCPPKGYYWHKDEKFCAPNTPPTGPNPPDCPKDCSWNKDDQYCQPNPPTPTPPKGGQCGKDEWSFSGGNKKCCLPHTPPSNPPSPPSGHQCPPKGYYWHKDENWNKDDQYCQPNPPTPTPPKGGDCGKNEWSFNGGNKKCCLPHTPPSNPPSPPSGHQCPPKGYYWHKDENWNHNDQYCQPNPPSHPQPSHGYGGHHYKRNLKSRSKSLCPTGLTACPISSLAGADVECLDTKVELESCGGCASVGQGQDCTTIKGAWNVGCEEGRCAVYTCEAGYARSLDGKSCIAL
ncbi:hypothetical protein DL96DRAFT_1550168 [Flagelloscypha sp. PMI_526]|nr:hypothetical protein DL96DRAFT_1550168 [Flagelloscypha sp. PMI_526]